MANIDMNLLDQFSWIDSLDKFSYEETMRKIWATEIESTCPCCGGPVILTMDYDGMARWVHEIWKFCECPWDMGGVILDFTIDGFSHELLVKEGEPINA